MWKDDILARDDMTSEGRNRNYLSKQNLAFDNGFVSAHFIGR